MAVTLRILDQDFVIECSPQEERRLEDLGRALDQRLAGFSGDVDGMRRLVLTAIALLGETQAAGAALARAHGEIERLNDMVTEAQLDAMDDGKPFSAFRAQGLA